MLIPAKRELVTKALGTALALVAPAGFSVADRELWLRAATMTLKDIPPDLLRRGVEAARLVVDHPSKIIPAIMAEVGDTWRFRKRMAAREAEERHLALAPPDPVEEPYDGPRMSADEIRAMPAPLRSIGMTLGMLSAEEIEAACPPKSAPDAPGIEGETE